MSKPPDTYVKLSETLSLCEYKSPKSGNFGFWLHDKTQGMNLAIRAKSSTDALVEALTYYQKRFAKVNEAHADLAKKVDAFVSQFVDDDDDDEY